MHPKSDQYVLWNERDEIQRLDFVAGVVAPTSLAGCVACAALIATGHLVDAANYVLGAAGLVLLGCAAIATLSLNWSPLEATHNGKDLRDVIVTKRSRTNKALAGLVLSVILGFGTTAVMELAVNNGNDNAQQKRGSDSKGPRTQQQQRSSRAVRLHDQYAGQDGDRHRWYDQSSPVIVDLRSGVVHRSLARETRHRPIRFSFSEGCGPFRVHPGCAGVDLSRFREAEDVHSVAYRVEEEGESCPSCRILSRWSPKGKGPS